VVNVGSTNLADFVADAAKREEDDKERSAKGKEENKTRRPVVGDLMDDLTPRLSQLLPIVVKTGKKTETKKEVAKRDSVLDDDDISEEEKSDRVKEQKVSEMEERLARLGVPRLKNGEGQGHAISVAKPNQLDQFPEYT
jgi:hypothetical protein